MAVYDNVASFHSKIHVFILLSKGNKRFFWCRYPIVSVYWHVFIIEATQHVQSAVLAEQVLPVLWLVRTARRTNSLQARVNGYKLACSTMYPIRNKYAWVRKNFLPLLVSLQQRRQASKSYIKRGLSLRSRICHRSGESSNEKEG